MGTMSLGGKGADTSKPKVLPFSSFDSNDSSTEEKMKICMASFDDVANFSESAKEIAWKVNAFLEEVNEIFGSDSVTKESFSVRLGKHPWFEENDREVKYSPSQNRINILPVSNKMPRVDDASWSGGHDYSSWGKAGGNSSAG